MKFSVVALVASVVAVASAIDYPFTEPQCISDCKIAIGKKIMPDYTTDPNNPSFMQSMEIEMTKGTPNYSRFMMEGGMCMTKCTNEEQQAYTADFPKRRAWYEQATGKNTTGGNNSTAPGAGHPPIPTGSGPSTSKPSNDPNSGASMLTVSGLAAAAAGAVAVALF